MMSPKRKFPNGPLNYTTTPMASGRFNPVAARAALIEARDGVTPTVARVRATHELALESKRGNWWSSEERTQALLNAKHASMTRHRAAGVMSNSERRRADNADAREAQLSLF